VARFLVIRLLYGAAVLVTVTSLVFGLIHLSGDPLDGLLPPGSSPDQEASIRRQFGLDRPLIVQYTTFIGHAAQGDFGDSWRQRQPAMRAVLERLPATLGLTAAAIGLALAIGVPLGVLAGTHPRGPLDALATGVALLGQALPGFWLGTVLILVFAVHLRWLPSSGSSGTLSLLLPALTLAAYPAATIARLLRSSLIETMGLDFIRTARGKGLSPWQVVSSHALRNAALPALAFVGLQVGFLLGGAVVVESVFAYPGVGRLALQAVADRDLPIIQAFVVVLAALIVAVNVVVDFLARWLDPRIGTDGNGTARAWASVRGQG
jgi:ABC-type dipeptide/oligopeptide/nickel transport system permease component